MPKNNINPNQLVQIKTAQRSEEIAAAKPGESTAPKLELAEVREKLSSARGPRYWRSLEELSNQEGFDELLEREFPRQSGEWLDPVSRRGFLKLMSASLALAGLSACTKQPEEAIVPYVQQPEELVPGKSMYYATACPSNMGAEPLLVRSYTYRPIKIEGNPEHAYSMGAASTYSQASILDLYDPDRSQTVTNKGETSTWGAFAGSMRDAANSEKGKQGSGIRFLTETVISPSLASQINAVLKTYPKAKWHQYDPVNRDSARAGSRMAFGQYLDPHYQLANADVIVSLDADFLSGSQFPGFLNLARDWAGKRKLEVDPAKAEMSRFYVVESQFTATGAKADHRLPLRAWEVEQFAGALAEAVGAGSGGASPKAKDKFEKFLGATAKDLKAARGHCVVIPGEQQTPYVHAVAAAINSALGNVGKTVVYTDPVETNPVEQGANLKELVDDMNAGKVSLLVIMGGNPVFNAPADLDFATAMQKVPLRAQLSIYKDETTRLSHWHVPMAHYLESWGDARCYDGTVSIIQPLIDPLYAGRNAYEVFALLTDSPGTTAFDAVKAYWQGQQKNGAAFEAWWRKSLHDGFIPGSAPAPKSVTAKPVGSLSAAAAEGWEIVFRPDPSIYDGRYVNNGWLQETPKPITKLTWDNAVMMSFNDGQTKGFNSQDVVEIDLNGRKVKAPVMIVPGHPEGTVTVYLGYGRTYTGRVGRDTGFNSYSLRTLTAPNASVGVKITKSGDDQWKLAVTQHQHLIDQNNHHSEKGQTEAGIAATDRQLIRKASLEEYRKNPTFAVEGTNEPESKDTTLYYNYDYNKPGTHKWGMTIDMNSCVGCNSCVVACQAENNIAVVGKEQVFAGRHMNWLRIDAYFESPTPADVANPRVYFQPIPCMQCENAPCEPVCPVGATVHSPEGLNDMVYNRCVGTRYCSNNCPYKVRRFNFLLFSDFETESLKGLRNPDVSVRSRGVMEKCTYCVQRINAAKIVAEERIGKLDAQGKPYDGKVHEDDKLQTACQQSCPTGAIIFGDLNDPNSKVSRMKRQPRNYGLLEELNTRPRTSYIAVVRNPNTEVEA